MMVDDTGQCKICSGYFRMVDGRLPEHQHIKTNHPCRGRWPRQSQLDDYPVGWDHHPAEINAGLPELGKNRKH